MDRAQRKVVEGKVVTDEKATAKKERVGKRLKIKVESVNRS